MSKDALLPSKQKKTAKASGLQGIADKVIPNEGTPVGVIQNTIYGR